VYERNVAQRSKALSELRQHGKPPKTGEHTPLRYGGTHLAGVARRGKAPAAGACHRRPAHRELPFIGAPRFGFGVDPVPPGTGAKEAGVARRGGDVGTLLSNSLLSRHMGNAVWAALLC